MNRRGFLLLPVAVGAFALPLRAQAPRTLRIDIQAFAFVPARVDARVGDTIEWVNRDFAPHTADGDGWTTGEIKNGAVGRFVATTAGTMPYRCKYHPAMKGAIVVTA